MHGQDFILNAVTRGRHGQQSQILHKFMQIFSALVRGLTLAVGQFQMSLPTNIKL
jgi:hypothetical protein